jgi:P pilus assembly chaperone PapD
MLIISLGMSLVGGFSISSYSKFQVTAETKQLVRQIQYLKRKAYLTESPYSLNFSDNRLQVTSKNETQRIIVFSHLHFEQQSVKLSRFGRSDSTKVSFIANDQNKHLSF